MAVSTICNTGFLLSHIRSIESSLLKIILSGGIVARNLNGGFEYVAHDVHAFDICSNTLLIPIEAFSGYAFLIRLYSFPAVGCMK